MRCIGSMAWGATALAALCLSAPARAEVVVNISKSQQQLEVVVNGAEAYRWPVSTGRRGYQTPSGTYHPIRLERHWYSHQYESSPMPWSVFFYRGYAVHGTMEAYNLGHAASHGCVRLRPDNASILFSLVRRHGVGNTRMVVMNGPLPLAPQLPGGVPMAKAAADDGEEHLSAKSHDPSREVAHPRADDDERAVRAHARTRIASVERISVSRGNEAQVLRERAAWLRSLDRKYGFAR